MSSLMTRTDPFMTVHTTIQVCPFVQRLSVIMCNDCCTDLPRNLSINPKQSIYKPGDRIQCSAEGNPEPSYHWRDLVGGTVVQKSVLVITVDMMGRNHTFQCTATNMYNGVNHNLSKIFEFAVTNQTGTCVLQILSCLCSINYSRLPSRYVTLAHAAPFRKTKLQP